MRGLHQGWKVTVLSEKAEYMSATEPYPVIINNHLAKEGRSIYVATVHLMETLLCFFTNCDEGAIGREITVRYAMRKGQLATTGNAPQTPAEQWSARLRPKFAAEPFYLVLRRTWAFITRSPANLARFAGARRP